MFSCSSEIINECNVESAVIAEEWPFIAVCLLRESLFNR